MNANNAITRLMVVACHCVGVPDGPRGHIERDAAHDTRCLLVCHLCTLAGLKVSTVLAHVACHLLPLAGMGAGGLSPAPG